MNLGHATPKCVMPYEAKAEVDRELKKLASLKLELFNLARR